MGVDGERRLTKNEKRRLREKSKKENSATVDTEILKKEDDILKLGNITIEYVSSDIDSRLESDIKDENLRNEFKAIFSKFSRPEDLQNVGLANENHDNENLPNQALVKTNEMDATPQEKEISKKKKKLLSRLSVAELKQLVQRPDVVEAHDVTSHDPKLLIHLKAMRNTVPVPRHWCAKRKYLQGKRGIEKLPFQLPEFIADTGIAKIRQSIAEQEALRKSKQKARERVQPKMGRIDIDYQVLHDAFFKYQTKPKMTGHGDLYYESKEFEIRAKDCRPGVLSPELKEALGISSELVPPPWLINMQRYGPPPSYPNLKIPGLNAPIPPGATYGTNPGAWGRPPVDEYGRPLYGDVFGMGQLEENRSFVEDVDVNYRWGAVIQGEDDDEDDDEDDEDDDENEAAAPESQQRRSDGVQLSKGVTSSASNASRPDATGLETPSHYSSGMSSIVTEGLETPAVFDLRKKVVGFDTPNIGANSAENSANKQLFHVLSEKQMSTSGQIFASDRGYQIPGFSSEQSLKTNDGTESVEESNKRKRPAEATEAVKRLKDFKF